MLKYVDDGDVKDWREIRLDSRLRPLSFDDLDSQTNYREFEISMWRGMQGWQAWPSLLESSLSSLLSLELN